MFVGCENRRNGAENEEENENENEKRFIRLTNTVECVKHQMVVWQSKF